VKSIIKKGVHLVGISHVCVSTCAVQSMQSLFFLWNFQTKDGGKKRSIHRVPRALSHAVRWPGREANH
jgi:hypothetical protein